MIRSIIFSLLTVCLTAPPVSAASKSAATELLSQNAIVVVQLDETKVLLDRLLAPEMIERVTSHPGFVQLSSRPQFRQFKGIISYLESTLDTDWKTALRKLTGGGVTLAIFPDGATLLIIDADDAKLLTELHKVVTGFAKTDAENKGHSDRVTTETHAGVKVWKMNDSFNALIDNRLIFSNRVEMLKSVLDRRDGDARDTLTESVTYQAARRAAGPDAVGSVYLNLAALKQAPKFRQALEKDLNPMAVLLFSGMVEAVRESNWLSAGLHVRGDAIALQVAVDGTAPAASKTASFSAPKEPGDGAYPNLRVPHRIAAMTLYRDLHGFYAAKDNLFPERTSALIFFENMMGIFFTGRDLTEEVLAQTKPDIRFVVAEQTYDANVGTPKLKLPAFAVVFRLREPKKFGQVIEEAWQKALGLINFTRGQQALPGMIIDRPIHNGTQFTMSYFAAAPDSAAVQEDTHLNFRPSLALVDDFAVLSSTDGLAKDLIDALKKETADAVQPLAHLHSVLDVDVQSLASILRSNRDGMVRNNMIEKGNSKEQAESEIDTLLTVLDYFANVKLDAGTADGHPQLRLELGLKATVHGTRTR